MNFCKKSKITRLVNIFLVIQLIAPINILASNKSSSSTSSSSSINAILARLVYKQTTNGAGGLTFNGVQTVSNQLAAGSLAETQPTIGYYMYAQSPQDSTAMCTACSACTEAELETGIDFSPTGILNKYDANNPDPNGVQTNLRAVFAIQTNPDEQTTASQLQAQLMGTAQNPGPLVLLANALEPVIQRLATNMQNCCKGAGCTNAPYAYQDCTALYNNTIETMNNITQAATAINTASAQLGADNNIITGSTPPLVGCIQGDISLCNAPLPAAQIFTPNTNSPQSTSLDWLSIYQSDISCNKSSCTKLVSALAADFDNYSKAIYGLEQAIATYLNATYTSNPTVTGSVWNLISEILANNQSNIALGATEAVTVPLTPSNVPITKNPQTFLQNLLNIKLIPGTQFNTGVIQYGYIPLTNSYGNFPYRLIVYTDANGNPIDESGNIIIDLPADFIEQISALPPGYSISYGTANQTVAINNVNYAYVYSAVPGGSGYAPNWYNLTNYTLNPNPVTNTELISSISSSKATLSSAFTKNIIVPSGSGITQPTSAVIYNGIAYANSSNSWYQISPTQPITQYSLSNFIDPTTPNGAALIPNLTNNQNNLNVTLSNIILPAATTTVTYGTPTQAVTYNGLGYAYMPITFAGTDGGSPTTASYWYSLTPTPAEVATNLSLITQLNNIPSAGVTIYNNPVQLVNQNAIAYFAALVKEYILDHANLLKSNCDAFVKPDTASWTSFQQQQAQALATATQALQQATPPGFNMTDFSIISGIIGTIVGGGFIFITGLQHYFQNKQQKAAAEAQAREIAGRRFSNEYGYKDMNEFELADRKGFTRVYGAKAGTKFARFNNFNESGENWDFADAQEFKAFETAGGSKTFGDYDTWKGTSEYKAYAAGPKLTPITEERIQAVMKFNEATGSKITIAEFDENVVKVVGPENVNKYLELIEAQKAAGRSITRPQRFRLQMRSGKAQAEIKAQITDDMKTAFGDDFTSIKIAAAKLNPGDDIGFGTGEFKDMIMAEVDGELKIYNNDTGNFEDLNAEQQEFVKSGTGGLGDDTFPEEAFAE